METMSSWISIPSRSSLVLWAMSRIDPTGASHFGEINALTPECPERKSIKLQINRILPKREPDPSF